MKVNSDSISAVPVMVMLSLAVTRSTIGAVLTFAMWAAFLLSTREVAGEKNDENFDNSTGARNPNTRGLHCPCRATADFDSGHAASRIRSSGSMRNSTSLLLSAKRRRDSSDGLRYRRSLSDGR